MASSDLDRLEEMVRYENVSRRSPLLSSSRKSTEKILMVVPELIAAAKAVKVLRRAHREGEGWATAENALADADRALNEKLKKVLGKKIICKCGYDPCRPEAHAGWTPR